MAVADAHPDAIALVDGDVRLTYRSLTARADALAARLVDDLGLQRDDRIVVQLPNCWQFVVLTLACLRAGIVPVMALPAHRQHELSYLAAHSESAALAVPATLRGFDHAEMAEELRAGSDTVEHVLVVGDDGRARTTSTSPSCAPSPTTPPLLARGGTPTSRRAGRSPSSCSPAARPACRS